MKAAAAARRSINSTVGLQKSFPAADHNDNIIQSELLIVNVSICVCARVCIMRHDGVLGATATGHESKRNSLAY